MKNLSQKAFYLCFLSCSFANSTVYSQIIPTDPSLWNNFVHGEKNVLIKDTFRIQEFEGSDYENWDYSCTGSTATIDASAFGIKNQGGKFSMKLSPGSSITFPKFNLDGYTNDMVYLSFAGHDVMPGENLSLMVLRSGTSTSLPNVVEIIKKISFSYRETISKEYIAKQRVNPLTISEHTQGLCIQTSPAASNTAGGFYCIDTVCVIGEIPSYSLFSGVGDWNDTTKWSHLPAARHRNALISGNINVNGLFSCNLLALHNSQIHINEGKKLTVKNLIITDENSSLFSSGELFIQDKLTVFKTFSEKGKWYFVSFPFDVYADGIDSHFLLQDKQQTGDGNYIYVQSYNGLNRAQTGNMSGNWQVLPASSISEKQPVFQKGKGYLIAIDKGADTQTLSFSSKTGDISSSFGKNARISIQASLRNDDIHDPHSGWFLCGNPLPGPLCLSQIIPNPALGDSVYIYDGTQYKTYKIGSEYILPQECAFFVKAITDTQMQIKSMDATTQGILLKNTIFSSEKINEPGTGSSVPTSNNLQPENTKVYLSGHTLYIENLPASGVLKILNTGGQVIISKKVPTGNSTYSIPIISGIYIINIHAGIYSIRQKCKIAE